MRLYQSTAWQAVFYGMLGLMLITTNSSIQETSYDTKGYFKFGNYCDARGREVHLKFMQDYHNSTKNHYDAILLFCKSGQVFDQDKHNFESPSPPRLQQAMQDHEDEVIDLTDESKPPS